jgi:hypothetical protein
VTKLQLENLQITDVEYDITYLHGTVEVKEGDPELGNMVRGPFYSWITPEEPLSLISAVRAVLMAVEENGPFDGVFGFSSGGLVAALACNIAADHSLRAAVLQEAPLPSNQRRFSLLNILAPPVKTNLKTDLQEPPFRFAIIACGASPQALSKLRMAADLDPLPCSSIDVPSVHLIGVEDAFKAVSEDIATLFRQDDKRHILYMASGHAVGRAQRTDTELCVVVKQTVEVSMGRARAPKPVEHKWTKVSDVSSLAMMKNIQVAMVRIELQTTWSSNTVVPANTIVAMLGAQPASTPLLRLARKGNTTTTYGQLLIFISPGGDGDLRRLGVQESELVAYLAPPGGSAASAAVFLSIGAQACAVPLAQSTTEPDALSALNQFGAKHLILFEGVESPGVVAAFRSFAASGRAQLHMATIRGDDTPGLFTYAATGKETWQQALPLVNPKEGTCLMLRTSGTTSQPKGVPLKQGELVANGYVLAATIGLREDDVCYGIMPLFHIGGISASVFCRWAVMIALHTPF